MFSTVQTMVLEPVDVGSPSQNGADNKAKKFVSEIGCHRFVHSTGPLFRVHLLRLRDDEYWLTFLLDHMICDGISLDILRRDLESFYNALYHRRPLPRDEALVQYGDYAVWQNQSQNHWNQHHGTYWRNRLAGAGPIFFQPDADIGQAPPQSACLTLRFGQNLSDDLRQLSQSEGTTLPMILLTAFVVLVSRWCNSRDVVVPFNSMGRLDPALMNTIGYFAHILHLRIELSSGETYREILAKIMDEFASACMHDDFGRIVRSMPQFVRGAWFQCEPGPTKRFETSKGAGNLELRRLEVPTPRYNIIHDEFAVDITFVLVDSLDDVVVTLFYRADRFHNNTICRIAERLRDVCTELTASPGCKPS
jgi:hypothetical protein